MINKVQSAKCKVQRRGFTLIELLVVISVIGILAALILARFGTVEKSARDARRKSDLNQYRTALENYGIKSNGVYPISTSLIQSIPGSSVCTALTTGNYLSQCLDDPRTGTTGFSYRYQTDAGGLNYILWASMETGAGTTNYWYLCASGKATEKQSAPVAVDCGF